MSRKLRVFVVDDSVVIRRLMSDIIATDPGLEVAGTAASGALALAKLPQAKADVVTLDVEMPNMNGTELLIEIKKTYPGLPVFMFSRLTRNGAANTLDALTQGATDYVTKPSKTRSREAFIAHVRSQLFPKIHRLARTGASPRLLARPRTTTGSTEDVAVVVIGASTGGPNALAALCARLPRLSVPIVIVQHMPPIFTKLFAERLSSEGATPFVEAMDGMIAEPGHGYVAPGDCHVRLDREGAKLRLAHDHGPMDNSCRPAVDVLFRSAAAAAGGRVLGLVLTGMGQDGLRGSGDICAAGGHILVQDEASSTIWGMPGVVERDGLADAVLSIGDLALEVERRVVRGGGRGAR